MFIFEAYLLKMFNKIFIIAALLLFQILFSQKSEPIYYDKDWKVTTKANASFYRLMPMKEVGELVLLQDFYINGTPQFEGYAFKNNEEDYAGEIVWYDEYGNDDTQRQYYNKTKNDILTYYHKNGKIRKKVQYKNGVKDGETIIYDTTGSVLMKGIYKEGKPVSGNFETIKDEYESNRNTEASKQNAVEVEPQIRSFEEKIPSYTPPPPPPATNTGEKTKPLSNSTDKNHKKTISQQIFWANTKNLAQEKVYVITKYDFDLIEQRNYDVSGKLIQTLTKENLGKYSGRISNGISYQYFLQNNFATGIKSTEIYNDESKSGKSISYFPNGKIFSETSFKIGYKEGEEIINNNNGSLAHKRYYKKDEPFNGNFDENIGEFIVNLNYVNGLKEGEAIAKNDENAIIAKGFYKDGKPYNGTFITIQDNGNRDNNELINVVNYQKIGLQKVFNYRLENLTRSYYIKNGKLNGLTTFYDSGEEIGKVEYKDDKPFNGTLVESETTTIYKDGNIKSETFYKDKYSKEEDNIEKKHLYENGILSKIIYQSFLIAEHPQKSYEGILKNEKPFSGFFETDYSREFKEVNYYENGKPKFQYSNNYLENMDNYRFQTYDIKSTYKDGKIFDGVAYITQNRQFITKYLKNGIIQSFDWDLFAVHYFNRIHFELKNNNIEISNMESEEKGIIQLDFNSNSFTKTLILNGKKLLTTNHSSKKNSNKSFYEKVTLYSDINGKIVSKSVEINEERKEEEYNQGSELFYKIYLGIDTNSATVQEIFNDLAENIGTENWLNEVDEKDILTGIRIDSEGNPKDGILITTLENDTYSLQLYKDGKKIKNIGKVAYKDIKNEVKKLEKLL